MKRISLYILILFSFLVTKTSFAEDPLLTEDFFDSPAQEYDDKGLDFDNESDFIEPPGAVSEPNSAPEKPSEPLFERHLFSGGIGISSGYFAIQGMVRSFFNDYFALENNLFYRREIGELDGLDYSLEFYGLDSALIAQYPVIDLLTPFVGAGPGFEIWSQLYDEAEFDKSNSLNAIVFAGTNINMTENLILQLRHVTKHYLTDQPRQLEDRSTKEDPSRSFFQVYFMISI